MSFENMDPGPPFGIARPARNHPISQAANGTKCHIAFGFRGPHPSPPLSQRIRRVFESRTNAKKLVRFLLAILPGAGTLANESLCGSCDRGFRARLLRPDRG